MDASGFLEQGDKHPLYFLSVLMDALHTAGNDQQVLQRSLVKNGPTHEVTLTALKAIASTLIVQVRVVFESRLHRKRFSGQPYILQVCTGVLLDSFLLGFLLGIEGNAFVGGSQVAFGS